MDDPRSLDVVDNIAETAGVSYTPLPNTIAVGPSRGGQPLFLDKNLSGSNDAQTGHRTFTQTALFLSPLSGVSKEDVSSIIDLAGRVSTRKHLTNLDTHSNANSYESFSKEAMNAASIPALYSRKGDVTSKLYDIWPKISDAQKSMALVRTALQFHRFPDGGVGAYKTVIKGGENLPSANVRQTLNMVGRGINVHSLSNHWSQAATLEKLAGGHDVPEEIGMFNHAQGLLGFGLEGSEVQDLSADKLKGMGYTLAPQFAPGAIAGPPGLSLPPGYVAVHQSQAGVIAVPKGVAPIAHSSLIGSMLGTKAGKGGISESAHALYTGWADKDIKAINGAGGGSAFVSGLINMTKTNPYVFSANLGNAALRYRSRVPSDDADYLKQLSGSALGRLMAGEASDNADNTGIKMTRMASSPKEIRDIFSSNGITSLADIHQLANQGFGENRFNASDLLSIQQVGNFLFGNSGSTALTLGKDLFSSLKSVLPAIGGLFGSVGKAAKKGLGQIAGVAKEGLEQAGHTALAEGVGVVSDVANLASDIKNRDVSAGSLIDAAKVGADVIKYT